MARTCRDCKAQVLWTTMESGKRQPLNAEGRPPAAGLVAYNPATRGGMMVGEANLDAAQLWAKRGVTFHESHFATCPAADKFRRRTH